SGACIPSSQHPTSFQVLHLKLESKQPFMPERFFDPHGVVYGSVGIMRRRFYTQISDFVYPEMKEV
ncbi:hypothetical protein, partial [Burkholderia ubonensis]|uniref:hypothetical protein n=1 Tax=Burkholderia ubonensis TaxID=101571 RepID=UPI001E4DE870